MQALLVLVGWFCIAGIASWVTVIVLVMAYLSLACSGRLSGELILPTVFAGVLWYLAYLTFPFQISLSIGG